MRTAPRSSASLSHLLARIGRAHPCIAGAALQRQLRLLLCLLAMIMAPGAWASPVPPTFNSVSSVVIGYPTVVNPFGIAVDPSGTLYVASLTNQIFTIAPGGAPVLMTITGPGASLQTPVDLALDSAGNLYIADAGNNRIVKVAPDHHSSVLDTTSVGLNAPYGVAVDASGNVFIADSGNHRVVEVPPGGSGAVLNITGVGAFGFVEQVALDTGGNLYIDDLDNFRLVSVPGASSGATAGSVINVTGLATPIGLPTSITTDNLGGLYVGDYANNRVVHVAADGSGSVVPTGSFFIDAPYGLKLGVDGTLYVADAGFSRVDRIANTAVDFNKVALGAGTGTTLTLPFTIPNGTTVRSVAVLTSGAASVDFKVGSTNTCTGASNTDCSVDVNFLPKSPGLRLGAVVLKGAGGAPLLTVPLSGIGSAPIAAIYPGTASVVDTGSTPIPHPYQSAFDGAGNQYVSAITDGTVYKIPPHGGSATVVNTGSYPLTQPTGLAVDGAGNLFISDSLSNRIVVVAADGVANLLTINGLASGISVPLRLQFDAAGTLYVDDFGNDRIVRVGALSVTDAGASGSGAVVPINGFTFGGFSLIGMAVDAFGNLFVADDQANQIIKVDPSGAVTVVATPGYTLDLPVGVAVDMAGNLYIPDYRNFRILQLTPAGTVNEIALPGLSLNFEPIGLTVSPTGNLYIDDVTDSRIIELNVGAAAPMTFPDTNIGNASAALTASIMNLGDLDLMMQAPVYPAAFPEDSFSSPLCGNAALTQGHSCVVAATFAPTAAGPTHDDIVITDNALNASNATQKVPVSGKGIGIAGLKLSTSALKFGDQSIGTTSATRTVTLTNSGQLPLHLFHILIDDAFHQASNCPNPLAIGASCSIDVSFEPDTEGAHSGTLTLVSNAPTSPDAVSLTGTGTNPLIRLSASALDFGQTINNQLTSRTLTVTNAGSGTLMIGQVTAPHSFTVSSNCGSLSAGSSCQMLIVFHTSKVGTITGELTIKSNAAKGTTRVALTGTNLAEPVNGSGAGAMGEDVLGLLAFAAWLRRRLKGRVTH